MHISSLSIYRYKMPLSAPIVLPMRRLHRREGLLMRIASNEREVGWGEVSPLPGFSREHLQEATRQAFKLKRIMTGHTLTDDWEALEDVLEDVARGSELAPSVRFGLELALRNLFAEAHERSLPAMMAEAPHARVAVTGLVTGTPEEMLDDALDLHEEGYRALKIKVGRGEMEEEARLVRTLDEIMGEEVALQPDANQGWDLDEALEFVEHLDGTPVAYLEEPLYRPEELPQFVEETGVPVALDESLREVSDEALDRHTYAHAVVLKPTVLGGMARTLRRARRASALGLVPVLSSAYETGIGTMGLVALAAVMDEERPVGVGAYRWLEQDVVRPRLKMAGGCIDVEPLSTIKRTMNGHMLREV